MRIFFFILLSLSIQAQDSGALTGSVTELSTGTKLPGVNIMVKGTYYGAATDLDGTFRIQKISPGSYDVEVSMIGYKVILKTGLVINPNETVTLDFTMEETVLSFGEDVVVLGKKPLFDLDETLQTIKDNKRQLLSYHFVSVTY